MKSDKNVAGSHTRSDEPEDPAEYHYDRGNDSDDGDGGETPFVGNHQVKVVRNLKRLR
jgi:hypothetical protein